jgi:hypothetical protein
MQKTVPMLRNSICSSFVGVALIGLFVATTHAEPMHLASAAGPFEPLGGAWSGAGVIKMKDGGQERLRCRGTYAVQNGGMNMRQDLRCASDSYNFEMSSDVTQVGDQLAGNWSENTHHVGGKVSGRATATTIQARAEGDTFTALLSVNTHGDHQSVTISSPGSAIAEVSIALTRAAK